MATKLDKIVHDIKLIKIQGAQNICKAGLIAWESAKNKKSATKKLIAARPTEPMLFNALDYANSGMPVYEILEKIEKDNLLLAKNGAELIKNNMKIFTHCHSSTVVDILIAAKKQGKHFEVYNTETRPLFQGRKTAADLAKAGIIVHHSVDSAGMISLSKADLLLIGADAITENSVFNKIGSGMFAELAKKFNVPVYVCSHSWKFSEKPITVEQRSPDEVWKIKNKKIKIMNPAFELIPSKNITGIVCEKGILAFKH